jgi:hypothetical protein
MKDIRCIYGYDDTGIWRPEVIGDDDPRFVERCTLSPGAYVLRGIYVQYTHILYMTPCTATVHVPSLRLTFYGKSSEDARGPLQQAYDAIHAFISLQFPGEVIPPIESHVTAGCKLFPPAYRIINGSANELCC